MCQDDGVTCVHCGCTHCDAHRHVADGVVVSDWFFSVKSTAASVNAGLDLEMPSPRWHGEKLLEAVEQGEVAEATIDRSVRRLLQLLVKAGSLKNCGQGH